ncbi:hypothetical protein [Tateyamaria sp. 1078]
MLFSVLAVAFFAVPNVVTAAWGLMLAGDAAFMGQRLAAAFAGFAVMLFLVRDAPPSPARRALASGVATALLLVAGVGVLGMAQGVVGGGILLAIAVELVIAMALILTGRATV